MKLRFTREFKEKLKAQVDYIAQDKPLAARKFKDGIIQKLKTIPEMPYKNRKSIFFDLDDIRDFVFKGYIIVYKIKLEQQEIELFGFVKYEQNPFED